MIICMKYRNIYYLYEIKAIQLWLGIVFFLIVNLIWNIKNKQKYFFKYFLLIITGNVLFSFEYNLML